MRIGDVASQAGVNRQTLRFYEREGLLPNPTRAANGYREYPVQTVALVQFIKRAQDLGFSLDEARALSELRHAPGANRLKVRALAEHKREDVRRRIAQLRAVERALTQLIETCYHGEPPRCPILEALTETPVTTRRTR
jgi:MerR family transcriptional regulator, copper efflux regulator